ncbi:hypothetical protein D3C71_1506980 [compost metagenome]
MYWYKITSGLLISVVIALVVTMPIMAIKENKKRSEKADSQTYVVEGYITDKEKVVKTNRELEDEDYKLYSSIVVPIIVPNTGNSIVDVYYVYVDSVKIRVTEGDWNDLQVGDNVKITLDGLLKVKTIERFVS